MTIVLLMILCAYGHSLMAGSPCAGASGDTPQNNTLTFKNTSGAGATITNIFIGGSIAPGAGASGNLTCSGGSPIEFTSTSVNIQVTSAANGGTYYTATVSGGGNITIPTQVLEENYWGTESGSKTYTASCNTFTYKLGAGAYQDIVLPANTYYNFTFNASAGTTTGGINGYKASIIAGGSGSSGISGSGQFNNMSNWYSGSSATTIRVLAKRTLGTWDCARFATFTINVLNPSAPTLNTATPANGTSICQGQAVSATINAGSGGSGSADTYEYSINGGSAWTAYTSGTNITTTTATTSVQIRVRRSAGAGTSCNAIANTVIVSWPVFAQPTQPTLNTETPANGTSICQGQLVSASINAGTGGTGATDTYEYSINGGSAWTAYTSGTNITTTTATASVQIRVRRSAGAGIGCNAIANTVIVSWPVFAQPTQPTLNTATPANGTSICQGQVVSASINAGTGGTGAADTYEYSIDGGSTWTAYTSGTNITTTTATTSVQIRVRRSAGAGTGCNAIANTVIVSWPVFAQPILPTLNTATPAAGNICKGQSVSATINAGSGGIGASDTYQYSIDGGTNWLAYTSGNTITTTTATTSVQIRVSRSTGTGLGCNAVGPSVISTWPIDLPPTATPNSQIFTCDNTASLNATGVTAGAVVSWQYVSGPVNPTGTTTSNPLLVTFSTSGTGIYNLLVSKGACNNINVGNISTIMPTTSTTTLASTASCGYCVVTNGNTRTFYNSNGQLVGKLEDDLLAPAILDLTEMCVRLDGTVKTVLDNLGNNQPYLQRQWTISPANNTKAKVTLYFTDAELSALSAAANPTIYQFSSYNLWVTKYPGGSGGSFTAPASLNGVYVPATFSSYGTNHKVEMEVSTYSTFYIHPALFPFAALPVELTSFTGYNQGAVNRLQWITASEQNTLKYEIQKSTSSANWSTIGDKAAAGNSTQPLNYDFTDNNPVIGNNYYRLRMEDIDGKFSFGNTINILITEAAINGFTRVYPNPTDEQLNVELQSTSNFETKLTVYDVVGKKAFERTTSVNKGLNTIQLDFSTLTKGAYVLQFADATGKIYTTKFIKD